MILSTLFLAAVAFTSTASAAPISANPAAIARATLEKRATWKFKTAMAKPVGETATRVLAGAVVSGARQSTVAA